MPSDRWGPLPCLIPAPGQLRAPSIVSLAGQNAYIPLEAFGLFVFFFLILSQMAQVTKPPFLQETGEQAPSCHGKMASQGDTSLRWGAVALGASGAVTSALAGHF